MFNFWNHIVHVVNYIILFIVKSLLIIVSILLTVAFYTLAERKIMGSMQRRRGPDVIGFEGALQPISDALKLLLKDYFRPQFAEQHLFGFGPLLMFVVSLVSWGLIPLSEVYINFNLSLIFLYAFNSLSVYGVILSGWASNSKYSFLGAMRAAAQMISYEVSLGFIFLIIGCAAGSYNLVSICYAQEGLIFFFPLFPVFVIFYISILAETNRIPFDLPEAEAELVAGYNTEYGSVGFVLFFLAEYSNMLLLSYLMVICFFKGWLGWGGIYMYHIKAIFISLTFIWIRATLPRYRFDQLMLLGWKTYLSVIISFFLFYSTLMYFFDALPVSNETVEYYEMINLLRK